MRGHFSVSGVPADDVGRMRHFVGSFILESRRCEGFLWWKSQKSFARSAACGGASAARDFQTMTYTNEIL